MYAKKALIHAPSIESESSCITESDAAAPDVDSAAAEGAAAELDHDAFDADETDEGDAAAEDRRRGRCMLCNNMFIGQDRARRPDGKEVHGECLELYRLLPKKKTTKDGSGGGGFSAAAADDTAAWRGTCALCRDGVFETDSRLRGQSKGDYVHERCHLRLKITEVAAACWSESSSTASGSSGGRGRVGAASRSSSSRVPSRLKRALTPRSRNALTMFRMFSESDTASSAADVAFAEELLVRGAAKLNEEDQKHVRAAVAMGELGMAGMLFVGKTLSASSASVAADSGSGHGSTSSALMCPICFDNVVIEGAAASSGGAVSCLAGHAMHAACASGLALSGGACPECREPLFFAKLDPAESRTAEARASLVAVSGSLIASDGGDSSSYTGSGGASSNASNSSSSAASVTVNGQGAPMQQSAENGKWYCGRRKCNVMKKDEECRWPIKADTVVLSAEFVKRAGAKFGLLKPGQEGTVIEESGVSLRVQTSAPGGGTDTWCYLFSDLVRKITDAEAEAERYELMLLFVGQMTGVSAAAVSSGQQSPKPPTAPRPLVWPRHTWFVCARNWQPSKQLVLRCDERAFRFLRTLFSYLCSGCSR